MCGAASLKLYFPIFETVRLFTLKYTITFFAIKQLSHDISIYGNKRNSMLFKIFSNVRSPMHSRVFDITPMADIIIPKFSSASTTGRRPFKNRGCVFFTDIPTALVLFKCVVELSVG